MYYTRLVAKTPQWKQPRLAPWSGTGVCGSIAVKLKTRLAATAGSKAMHPLLGQEMFRLSVESQPDIPSQGCHSLVASLTTLHIFHIAVIPNNRPKVERI